MILLAGHSLAGSRTIPSAAGRRVPFALLLLLLAGDARGDVPPPFLRGMSLGQYSDITKAELETKLGELRRLGVSHVSLVISWSTRDIRSTEIAPLKGATTPDAVLGRMIDRAHALGLKVFLFPIIDVQQRKLQEWRGAIRPPNWDDWWRSYRRFILHYASLAERHKVELFAVGSELVSTERMRDRWQNLIARVRQVFTGKLVYSANWDHYEPVSFWDLVDAVGLTAYYQIARAKNAPETEMLAAWSSVRGKLSAWSRRIGRPFIFTEVGYPSLEGCAVAPWDYTVAAPASPEEQRRAYSAFIRAWRGSRELAGVVFWDWYGAGGPKDTLYTPRGKPAEGLIRSWFTGLQQR